MNILCSDFIVGEHDIASKKQLNDNYPVLIATFQVLFLVQCPRFHNRVGQWLLGKVGILLQFLEMSCLEQTKSTPQIFQMSRPEGTLKSSDLFA